MTDAIDLLLYAFTLIGSMVAGVCVWLLTVEGVRFVTSLLVRSFR